MLINVFTRYENSIKSAIIGFHLTYIFARASRYWCMIDIWIYFLCLKIPLVNNLLNSAGFVWNHCLRSHLCQPPAHSNHRILRGKGVLIVQYPRGRHLRERTEKHIHQYTWNLGCCHWVSILFVLIYWVSDFIPHKIMDLLNLSMPKRALAQLPIPRP